MKAGQVYDIEYSFGEGRNNVHYLIEVGPHEDNGDISGTVLKDAYMYQVGQGITMNLRNIVGISKAERPFADGDEVYYAVDDSTLRRVEGEWYIVTKNTDDSVRMYLESGTFTKVDA